MRRALQIIHSLTLRVLGLYGLVHIAIWLAFIDSFTQQNMGHPFPLTVLALFTATCLLCAFGQKWMPRALARPSTPLNIAALLPAGLITWGLFFLAATICISMMQWEEPSQRNTAFLSAFVSFAILSLAGLFGVILALWPGNNTPEIPTGSDRPTRSARTDNPFARLQHG